MTHKVYSVRITDYWDYPDNGTDSESTIGIFATKELAINAIEKYIENCRQEAIERYTRLIHEGMSDFEADLEDVKKFTHDKNWDGIDIDLLRSDRSWGDHSIIYLAEETLYDDINDFKGEP